MERELIANWNATMYPDPVLPEAVQPTYGAEQVAQVADEMPGYGNVSLGQFLAGTADTAAAGLKGAVQGFVGLPGDLEMIGRMLINLVGGDLDEKTYLSTTDEIKKVLDQYAPMKPISKMPAEELGVAETIGEFASPAGQIKAIKAVGRGVRSAVPKMVENAAKPQAKSKQFGGLLVSKDKGKKDFDLSVTTDKAERFVIRDKNNPGIILTTDPIPEDGIHMGAYVEVVDDIEKVGGKGSATNLYLQALKLAKNNGMGWASDVTASDATVKMYKRLVGAGVPFEEIDGMFRISPEKLAAVDIDDIANTYNKSKGVTRKKPEAKMPVSQEAQ
jgi:hypothetical protein